LQLLFRERCLNLMAQGNCINHFEIDRVQQKVRYCLAPYTSHILDL